VTTFEETTALGGEAQLVRAKIKINKKVRIIAMKIPLKNSGDKIIKLSQNEMKKSRLNFDSASLLALWGIVVEEARHTVCSISI